MSRVRRDVRSGAWRAARLPLAIYLGVTLAVPALGGGYADASFWAHAIQVTLTTLVVLALWIAVTAACRRGG